METIDILTEKGAPYVARADLGGWTVTLTDEKGASITLTDLTLTDLTFDTRTRHTYPHRTGRVRATFTRGTFEIDVDADAMGEATGSVRVKDAGLMLIDADVTDLGIEE